MLYNEIIILNSTLSKIKESEDIVLKNSEEIWCKIFQNADLPQLLQIVSKILSVPVSNAFPERIFSLMSNLWTDERNKMRVDLVKAELCTKINFNMSCQKFADFLESREQIALLRSCQSNTKYRFKFT